MLVEIKCLLKLTSPVSFGCFNMATRKYKITFMAHITFLLNNTAQGGTPCFEGFRERLQKQIITGLHGNTRINILV